MDYRVREQLEPYSQRGSPELESLDAFGATDLFQSVRDQLIFLEVMERRERERAERAGGDEPEPEPELDFSPDRRFLQTVRDNVLERLARLQNQNEPEMNFLNLRNFRLGGRGKAVPKIIWSD